MGNYYTESRLHPHGESWAYWARRLVPEYQLSPLRITMLYAMLGALALYVSDVLFVRYLSDPLLSQVQSLKGGLEVLLTAGLIYGLSARRETQLQRKTEQIDRQREELQVLHRVFRHNLRNDLNVVLGYTEDIRATVSEDELEDDCEKVLEAVEQLTTYTEQAKRINYITRDNDDIATHDLTALVPAVVDACRRDWDSVDVSSSVPEAARIEANRMFREALRELLDNAIEHNDRESPSVSVTVETPSGSPHLFAIRIRDDGPGIPEDQLETLRSGKEEALIHMNGLGLWFVQWTIRHSNGTLRFERNDDGGTTAIVEVPKAPDMLTSTAAPLNAD